MDNLPAKDEGKKELAPIPANPIEGTNLTHAELEVIHDYLHKSRFYPIATGILKCKGKSCDYADKCPLVRLGKAPEYGTDCPMEKALIEIWATDLVNDLDLDPTDVVDQSQVMRLVYHRLFDKRAMEILAEDPLVLDEFKTVTLGGETATEKKIHPLVAALEKSHKISDRIMQTLIATREAKNREKVTKQENVLDKMARVVEKVEKLKNKDDA